MRRGGPYARLFYDAVEACRQHQAAGNPGVRMGLIENALQRAVAEECVRYETRMVVLGSLVSGAPFIGLLGTVWGVMVAFSGMGVAGNATLQNLAPGVASALLATVSGLLVAIPSVFGYNFLLTQVKMMITELENFASWLADRMELEFEAQKSPPAPVATTTIPAATTPAPVRPVEKPAPPPSPVDPSVAPLERYLRFDVSDEVDR
jgi:biopolymer transport protein TolQ